MEIIVLPPPRNAVKVRCKYHAVAAWTGHETKPLQVFHTDRIQGRGLIPQGMEELRGTKQNKGLILRLAAGRSKEGGSCTQSRRQGP